MVFFSNNLIARPAGSLSQEVTEAIVWKDRVDTDSSVAQEVVIIPARHRSLRRLRVAISEKQGSISVSRPETGTVFPSTHVASIT